MNRAAESGIDGGADGMLAAWGIPSRGRRQQQPDKRAHRATAERVGQDSTIIPPEAAMNDERHQVQVFSL